MKTLHYPKLTRGLIPPTLVLANGDYPRASFPLSVIAHWVESRQTELVRLVCCDGAINKLRQYTDTPPNAIVGDLDSVSDELKRSLAGYIHHIPDQNTNDLTKAVTFAHREWGISSVCILGASGGREDHFLANLALLSDYRYFLDEVIMLTDTGYFRVVRGRVSMEVEIGQQISLYSFVPNNPITARGLRWPLEAQILPALWSGSLNRAEEEIIEIEAPEPILVFVADEKKD